ncbi:MAG: kinase [Oligoflexia bacterium]|nr:kinase [Oligoflexia bacterium]
MIISRTPYRISFFGGGTDYPEWFKNYGGAVLSTSIDKYCYITCRMLPPFFEHKYRIVYSIIEMVEKLDQIKHPSVRETLKYLNATNGLEIHHDGDIPARSGIGSSSSFTVGLLNAISSLQGKMLSKHQLATDSIYIEQKLIGECVGSQDQVSTAFGGFNHIVFNKNGEISVRPLTISAERVCDFENHLMLFFTGFSRISSDMAKKIIQNMPDNYKQLSKIQSFVDEAISVINSKCSITLLGELLQENWMHKKMLSNDMSSNGIDEIYREAKAAGAIGGKIIGAGGGGFLLLLAKPENQIVIKNRLKNLLYVPFSFDYTGSQILYYDNNSKKYVYDDEHGTYVYRQPASSNYSLCTSSVV